jgi:hypothetical protein
MQPESGQPESGQPESGQPEGAGLTWAVLLDGLVTRVGSLSAVAERLAETRGFTEDVGSIERALRRLRSRGTKPGGKWGTQLVRIFGLPGGIERRLQWMGTYHSRFLDLPVVVCEELVIAWDHDPIRQSAPARVWLALARASLALRRSDMEGAAEPLMRARSEERHAPPEARIELRLTEAYRVSRTDPEQVTALLGEVEPLLALVQDESERLSFFARWIDQRAYELNHKRGERPPDVASAERLYLQIPPEGVPPFAASRRANGLAYCRWKQGDREQAVQLAQLAARQAGDGGHVRLRAMALSLLARIDPSQGDAGARARAIAARLEDETLRLRFDRDRRRG